jgi:predicted Ser/Thr protein kinase/predicted Zn-dependent protease
VGEYDIIEEIARGGMGVVYKARAPVTGQVVALKVLLAGSGASEDQVRRFEREIRTGRALDHPGIVKVHDAGTDKGNLFFTMEYVEGRSLDHLLEALPRREKVAILERVALAMAHAHERGVIHRDLKPQNILVTEDRDVKVVDFGLSRLVDAHTRLTKTGALVGTPFYMAPEQAAGAHDSIDARTDVYALGAILYQVITGELPFRAETALALIGLIMSEPPRDPCLVAPTCPRELGAIALKALEKDPGARFQTAGDLAHELARWLAGERVTTALPGHVFARRARRARRKLGAVAFVVAAALGILAFSLWRAAAARRAAREAELLAAISESGRRIGELLAQPPTARERHVADERSAWQDTLAKAEELLEAPDGDESSRGPLERALSAARLEEKTRALETLLLVQDAAFAREAELPALSGKLEKALARRKGDEDLAFALASVLERLGATEQASAALESATSAPALEREGELRLELDDPKGASQALEKALIVDPARRSARLLLAEARFQARDPAAQDAVSGEKGRDARVLAALATWLRDRPLGLEQLRSLEREQRDDAVTVRRLGELLVLSERPLEARHQLDRALELAPHDARVLLARSEAALLAGDLEKALADAHASGEQARPGTIARARARAWEVELRALASADAASLLDAALAERPGDAELSLVRFELQGEVSLEARNRLVAFATSLGGRAQAARAWALVASLNLARKDAAGAATAARRALAIGRDVRSLALLGELGGAAERHEAHAAFATSPCLGARLLRASNVLDRLDARFHQPEDATASERLLGLAARAAPWAPAPRIERARRLARAGDKDAASQLLEEAIAAAGGDPGGNALLASLLLERDAGANAARAESLAEAGLAFAPKCAPLLAARGRARLGLGRAREALADLDASLALDRHDAVAWSARARACAQLDDAEGAEKARVEADERGPRRLELSASLWHRADGLTLNAEPKYLEAIPLYRRALDLDPTNAVASARLGAHLLIGFALYPDEPLYRLSQAAYWDPGSSGLDADVVRSLRVASDVPATATRIEKEAAESGKIEDLWLAAYCREMVVESGAEGKDELGLARLALERVLDAEPTEIAAYVYRGYVRAVARQSDLARQDEELALRYFPKCGFAWFALGLNEARDGRPERAREVLRRAMEGDPTLRAKIVAHEELAPLLDPK